MKKSIERLIALLIKASNQDRDDFSYFGSWMFRKELDDILEELADE